MENLRKKSKLLTSFLVALINKKYETKKNGNYIVFILRHLKKNIMEVR
jgi:hypothetical protein